MAVTQGSRTREASRSGTYTPYPPAPWRIAGPAMICPALVPLDAARDQVPGDVEVVAVAPGRTAGGFLLAAYEGDSTLHYGELLVVAALTRVEGKLGLWISHAYVDSPASLAGGRRMWGVPKDLATFDWDTRSVTLTRDDGTPLLETTFPRPKRLVPIPALLACNGTTGAADRRRFVGTGQLRLAPARAAVTVASASPLASLALAGPRRLALAGDADVRIRAPRLLA
jgi:hypothetical protein